MQKQLELQCSMHNLNIKCIVVRNKYLTLGMTIGSKRRQWKYFLGYIRLL